MEKLMVHRGNNVVDTASNHVKLKHIIRKFNSSADPVQERIHVENNHPDGKIFKGKYPHTFISLHILTDSPPSNL